MSLIMNELLAPAGNVECALAAFEAGADAVYLGLPKFNARERCENFTPESLGSLAQYAHDRGKKVYGALNTVVKESELAELAVEAAALSDAGVDAVIVQDLGVLRLLREYFPELTIHASTQMGFHNRSGLKIAAELGVKRVIMERQVTLEELKEMLRDSPVEIEVFIHGALCCSLSGQCLFSSYLGGHSGNRGKCKQPCRRRYFARNGNGFFFSPRDLATPELMGELRNMGIASFKIEGRLRQADYVFNAVSAYRKLIDAPEITREVLGESRKLLALTYGRQWSEGFFREKNFAGLVNHTSPGAAGQYCGRIERLDDHGFAFTAVKRMHVGDRLRVQPESGDEGTAFTLTRMLRGGKLSKFAREGDKVYVFCDKDLPERGMIYKTGESGRAFRTDVPEKARIKLDLECVLDGKTLQVCVKNVPVFPAFERPLVLEKAKSRGVDAFALQKEFAASASENFALGAFAACIEGDFFLPVSVLKSLRREFWLEVERRITPEAVLKPSAAGLSRFYLDYAAMTPAPPPDHPVETVAVRPGGAMPGKPNVKLAMSVYQCKKGVAAAVMPEFCAEKYEKNLASAVRQAYENGVREFRVTSLFGFDFLRGYPDVVIVAADPIPVANSMAALELARLGAKRVQAHIELEKEAIVCLAEHSPLPVELCRHTRPVLLVTRAALPVEGEVADARGNKFLVRYDRFDRLTRIYAGKVFSIPKVPGTLDFYDLTMSHWKADDPTSFNFENPLI